MATSKHESMWTAFSSAVVDHIKSYVLPQYGDADEDMMKDYTPKELVQQASKYLGRFGRSSRPGEEKRDLIKAAHCIQKAWEKLP